MTSVGHSLTGLSIAVLLLPRDVSRRRAGAAAAAAGFLANAPDLPLPGWGHASYAVSHSLFVTATIVGAAAGVAFALGAFRHPFAARALAAMALAWLSHLLLDSLYSHGRGVGVFWPLSDVHLALPLPWFDTLDGHVLSPHNLQVLSVELLFYGALLGACLGLRRKWGVVAG